MYFKTKYMTHFQKDESNQKKRRLQKNIAQNIEENYYKKDDVL